MHTTTLFMLTLLAICLFLVVLLMIPIRAFLTARYSKKPLTLCATLTVVGGRFGISWQISEQMLLTFLEKFIEGDAPAGLSLHDLTRFHRWLRRITESFSGQTKHGASVLKTLSRLKRSLTVEKLHVIIVLGHENPALTGQVTGACWAVAGLLTWVLKRSARFSPGQPRFFIRADFNSPNITVDAALIVRAPLRDFLLAGIRLLLLAREFRKHGVRNSLIPRKPGKDTCAVRFHNLT